MNIPAVNAESDITGIEDALAHIRDNGARIGMIPTSTDHFFWVMFLNAAGIPLDEVRLIGYPDTGSQVPALLANEIDFTMLNLPSGGSFFEDGSFRPIGVAHDERLGRLPDTPTIQEQGLEVLHSTNRGLFAPLGTPPERIEIIAEAFRRALENEELVERITNEFGSVVNFLPPDEYQEFLDNSQESLGVVAREIDFDQ